MYSGLSILHDPFRQKHVVLKLKLVLKWRDFYIGNIRVVSSEFLNLGISNCSGHCKEGAKYIKIK